MCKMSARKVILTLPNLMTDMIHIDTAQFGDDVSQAINVKDLYEYLWARKNHYSRWCQRNIVDNIYAIEWEDYIISNPSGESNEYILSIDFAKKLSMITDTPKSEEIRKYFIQVEKAYKKVVNEIKAPKTYLEALKEAVAIQEKLELASWQLTQAQDTIKALTHSGKFYTTTEIAKEMGMKSAKQLNEFLEEKEIQYNSNGTWVLRSWYAEKQYVSIKQMVLENGKVIYDRKWTDAGRQFLLKKFEIII